jgi:hypothetical protein
MELSPGILIEIVRWEVEVDTKEWERRDMNEALA